ncbi:MAG: sulfatase [Flavobacterium sp.]|uniref:formylglycine-generating enzyme family protein n=1 Tax=Flavobacterium sp. TaxID=239 RepID=UPI000C4D4DFD|nr:formylglycine-generating enzyme family protein [Flavobacterium sp.]MBF04480.1 sulfatase [Flavobacterium sp.]|tara:strand:- start:1170 stop:2249 length:1080 start_codon:yes stop_codon:yes gene_type:complete
MKKIVLLFFILFMHYSCKKENAENTLITDYPKNIKIPDNMIWVSGKTFTMGAKKDDKFALAHEKPSHSVAVDGFFIDATEVTNAQFKKFVAATGYITQAEKPIDWNEMKKSLPEGTPKPADSILLPGSLVFNTSIKEVDNLQNYQQWWKWMIGANWKHPYGKDSSIEGKDDYPVVHVTIEDALAYCKWANRSLPTEAQWELAAMGNLENTIYSWGNTRKELEKKANTWQGIFPTKNTNKDGYELLAPVKSFPPNSIGLYDMAGNVWEYTLDWYNTDYYQELFTSGKTVKNPTGAVTANNPNNPYQKEKIIKGGSFLCNDSYCSSFRISARMGMTEDSSSDHVGFRTIATIEMIEKEQQN